MSIKVHIQDPCSKNISKLLHAIAEYIDVNQVINVGIDLDFPKEKKKQ